MTFQDAEDVRDSLPPTISRIHGEMSGHLRCSETSPAQMGQMPPEKLFAPISSHGWHSRAWLGVLVTLRWIKLKEALSCVLPEQHLLGYNARCKHLSGFGLVESCIQLISHRPGL